MFVAHVEDALAIASPGSKGVCPGCKGAVSAKCGKIVCWHWAHRSGRDCDPWAERDTRWHRDWQAEFPLERTEVIMGPHRADAVTRDGRVVEFQHSSLSVDDIQEREKFYGYSMIWIFDATHAREQERFLPRHDARRGIWTFRWKHARKSVGACRANIFLDLGGGELFEVRRIHAAAAPVGGWGRLIKKQDVLSWTVRGEATEVASPTA